MTIVHVDVEQAPDTVGRVLLSASFTNASTVSVADWIYAGFRFEAADFARAATVRGGIRIDTVTPTVPAGNCDDEETGQAVGTACAAAYPKPDFAGAELVVPLEPMPVDVSDPEV